MEPEEALHWHILRRKKDGVEDWIDKSVEKIGAVPTLNDVLLPAMKEVGDKFGAGELILPFVLQSAEVMKRAVAQLENYLEKIEGHTKGKVVIATVFGDVHDIGKSLVNTILTNNGYTVVDLGKQVPVDTIIDAAVEHEADAIGLSALLVSTSKQMPLCVQELHERGLEFPVLIGGAAINRDFGRRILYPKGKESDEIYEPGVFYCKDAFQGLDTMDAAGRRATRARRSSRRSATEAQDAAREAARWSTTRRRRPTTRCARRRAPTRRSPSRRSGACARSTSTSTRSSPTSTATCCSSSTGAAAARRARSGARSSRATATTRASRPSSSACGASRTTSHPRARLGYFPCNADGNELVIFDPEDPDKEIERLVFPRQPKHDRICLADFFRPLDSGERDVVALQGVTVGPEVDRADRASSRRTASSPSSSSSTASACRRPRAWPSGCTPRCARELGIDPDQGRRYSWGYPACPDQSEHEKVWRLLDLEQIGMTLSGGYAVMPEQSTVAIVAHHPQAVYFGMKSGFIPEDKQPGRADRRHRPRRRAAARGRAARATARSRPRASSAPRTKSRPRPKRAEPDRPGGHGRHA